MARPSTNSAEVDWPSANLRKGVIEILVLGIIRDRPGIHGYAIKKLLANEGCPVADGTMYGITARLRRDRLVRSERVTVRGPGVARRCYFLTSAGTRRLKILLAEFKTLGRAVRRISRG